MGTRADSPPGGGGGSALPQLRGAQTQLVLRGYPEHHAETPEHPQRGGKGARAAQAPLGAQNH